MYPLLCRNVYRRVGVYMHAHMCVGLFRHALIPLHHAKTSNCIGRESGRQQAGPPGGLISLYPD
jgi:hypothetical protein